MSAAASADARELGGTPEQERCDDKPRHRRSGRGLRRAALAGGAVVVLAAAGGEAAWKAGVFHHAAPPASGVVDNAYPTGLATVALGSLSSQQTVNATLGYAGSYTVQNRATGVYTHLPAAGQIIRRGHVLYWVSGNPVVLLYGSIPSYRSLSKGMTGADVQQLNANLVALGYAKSSELDPKSDYFSAETAYALEQYQYHLVIPETGTLDLGQAVFLPGAARVTAIGAQLGSQAGPGPVFQATSTSRQVAISLDASQQSYVKKGDKVTITLPGNQTTPGVVSYVGTVATSPPSTTPGATTTPVITVDVTPTDPGATGLLDQAPVTVSITTAFVSNVLTVPSDALVSLAGGGYAVEVVRAGGIHRLIPVSIGLFDDSAGTVQVSGTGLQAGQHVVVPSL